MLTKLAVHIPTAPSAYIHNNLLQPPTPFYDQLYLIQKSLLFLTLLSTSTPSKQGEKYQLSFSWLGTSLGTINLTELSLINILPSPLYVDISEHHLMFVNNLFKQCLWMNCDAFSIVSSSLTWSTSLINTEIKVAS